MPLCQSGSLDRDGRGFFQLLLRDLLLKHSVEIPRSLDQDQAEGNLGSFGLSTSMSK